MSVNFAERQFPCMSRELLEAEQKDAVTPYSVTLDKAGDVYAVSYWIYPLDPKENYYEFEGITPDAPTEMVSFVSKNLDDILGFINKNYPLMQEGDWDTYDRLSQMRDMASRTRSFCDNQLTREQERDIKKELDEFSKLHKLPYLHL